MKIDRFEDGYDFLSNFFLHPVTMDGVIYNSTEVAYQAAKTLDLNERDLVRQKPVHDDGKIVAYIERTPGQAKKEGRRVTLRPDWERVKIQVMEDLVRQKFQHPALKEQLLATGTAELVEGNWWNDTFWGVCNGKGENHLGRILMKIREELKNESK